MSKTYTVKEKQLLVEKITKSKLPVKKACKKYGISDASFYAWRKQLNRSRKNEKSTKRVKSLNYEPLNLDNKRKKENVKSKKKRHPSVEITKQVEKLVCRIKKKYPYYGIIRIGQHLRRFENIHVTPTKILGIVEKHGLKETQFYEARQKKEPVRFERSSPNQLWATDIMPYRLKNGDKFNFMGIIDDHSRFVLAYRVCKKATVEVVIGLVKEAIRGYGHPKEILTDRGIQYHSWNGTTQFEKFLALNGIRHIMSRPKNPSCNGKIESVHRNIQKELLWRKFMKNTDHARKEIDAYVKYYNHERPHQGIGGVTPADRYHGIQDEIQKHVIPGIKEGNKAYVTARIGKGTYRIENSGGKIILSSGKKIIKKWNNTDSLPHALFELSRFAEKM